MNKPEEKSDKKKPRGFKVGCVVLVIIGVLGFFLYAMETIVPQVLGGKPWHWESRARAALRAYGEHQLEYQFLNNAGAYGSLEDLKDAGMYPEDYNTDNVIENYTLWESIDNPSLLHHPDSEDFDPTKNTFTAVAFPRSTEPPGYLATFAIREDQVLRVYRPETTGAIAWSEDGDYGCMTWEPIR